MASGFDLKVPDHLEQGVYANVASVWHTRSEFTIDLAIQPASNDLADTGRLVSRVRVPAIYVFELIRKLNASMTDYERKYGEIPRYDDFERS